MIEAKRQASDPATSGVQLQKIAFEHPDLQVDLLRNPSVYPDLVDWISKWGTPEAQELAKRKIAGENVSTSPAAAPALPSVPTAMVVPPPKMAPGPDVPAPAAPALATTGPKATEPGATNRSLPVWIWIVIGSLVAAIIGALVWFLVIAPKPADADGDAGDNLGATSSEVEKDVTEEVTVEEIEEVTVDEPAPQVQQPVQTVAPVINYPAPPNSQQVSHFSSPSGNINCEIEGLTIACTITDREFVLNEPGCTSGPATIVLTESESTWDCDRSPVASGGTSLPFSQAASADLGACVSSAGGMICWNLQDGQAFALSRQDWIGGTSGVIPENRLPWISSIDRR